MDAVTPLLPPQLFGMRDRVDATHLPPFFLIANGVECAVVGCAEGHGPFVTHLAAHGPRLRESDGLFALVLPGSESPFDVQYTIDGPVTRIPLFVPDTPTEPGGEPIAISVRGGGDVSLRDVFPRFRESGGVLLAELDNVPSAIRLPTPRTFSTNRLADGAVIVVLVMGTVWWLLRNRAKRVTIAATPKP